MKPLLRWAGSKKQIINHLAKYWNNSFSRYLEPFAGSASLFFKLEPRNAILSDLNPELINTYQEIKENPHPIISQLSNWKNSKEDYYRIRSKNNIGTPSFRAARFIYLNNYCFNGLYRTNQRGEFNVPYGGEKSARIIQREDILNASRLLKNATIVNKDFEEVIADAVEGDFIYLDPPYKVNGKGTFIEYGPVVFSDKDLLRLESTIKKLASKNISFLLSYIESDEAEKLATGFSTITFSITRNISGFSSNSKTVNEILISNIEFLL